MRRWQSRSGMRLAIMIMEKKSVWVHFTAARMQLDGVRDLGKYGKLYDLVKYPDS